jgi:DNA-binding GntR family transcriptional regulator
MERAAPLPVPTFSDPRRVSIDVHDYLRRIIIEGRFPAGALLKQTELAREFGVSRTPLREAFRMLQEEGLIVVVADHSARVRELDATELDQLYGARIALETLAVRITAGRLSGDEVEQARTLLNALDSAAARADRDEWMHAHRAFHDICTARADAPLLRVVRSYADRTDRYLKALPLTHPDAYELASAQHEQIWQALVEGTSRIAGNLTGHHLAGGGERVLRQIDPAARPTAIREALAMVTQA